METSIKNEIVKELMEDFIILDRELDDKIKILLQCTSLGDLGILKDQ